MCNHKLPGRSMIKIGYCLLLLLMIAVRIRSQSSTAPKLFEVYKKDKKQSVLPDFSWAGYHCGEKSIPNVKGYKIFNVLDFGAKPNDDESDRDAIQQAIDAANENGSGIVFFPKGRFIVNDDSTLTRGIISKGSNIIFRGSGSRPGGTELFMKETLVPENPNQMWTGRPMFTFTTKGSDKNLAKIVKPAAVGDFVLKLENTNDIQPGDWVAIKLLDNSPELVAKELAPGKPDPSWTYIVDKGIDICMYYQVVKASIGSITLHYMHLLLMQ